MGGFGFDSWKSVINNGGGAKYFSIKPGENAVVRFMYNTVASDIKWYQVHEFNQPGNNATISCAEPDYNVKQGVCKWCAMGNVAVRRVIIPVFNLATNQIEYWKRTMKFVNDSMLPLFEDVEGQGKPICAQQYKILRQGSGLQTSYTIIPQGLPDATTMADLGTPQDPFDINMIRPSDYDYNPNAQPAQQNTNNQAQPQQGFAQNGFAQGGFNQAQPQQGFAQGGFNQQPQATRRTVDTF